jgi:hypothetical protein
MRLALLASTLTAAAMWLALGGAPAQSQTEAKPATCATCGQGSGGPHCAKGADCPYFADGKACPHCTGHPHFRQHKWEYQCVHQSERANKKAADAMTEQFNALGEEGWRLAKADAGFWCFMRIRASE